MDKVMLFETPEERDEYIIKTIDVSYVDEICKKYIKTQRTVNHMTMTVTIPNSIPCGIRTVFKEYNLEDKHGQISFLEDYWAFTMSIAFSTVAVQTDYEHDFIDNTDRYKRILNLLHNHTPGDYSILSNHGYLDRVSVPEVAYRLIRLSMARTVVVTHGSHMHYTLESMEKEAFYEMIKLAGVKKVQVRADVNTDAKPLIDIAETIANDNDLVLITAIEPQILDTNMESLLVYIYTNRCHYVVNRGWGYQ